VTEGLGQVEVLAVGFTPNAGASKVVVQAIDGSRHEVMVQAYGFTHNAIAQALVRAHERGVKVYLLMDQKSVSTNRYVVDLMQSRQIPLRLDGAHSIAHNKVMVIDGEVVVTGSFNFTNSADTRNAENIIVLKGAHLAQTYRNHWLDHWEHSK